MVVREFKTEPENCVCCKPKSTDKVTKAYARGTQDEQDRIVKLLEAEKTRSNLGFVQYKRILELIKGEPVV